LNRPAQLLAPVGRKSEPKIPNLAALKADNGKICKHPDGGTIMVVRSKLLILVIALVAFLFSSAFAGYLKPRYIPIKPANTAISPGYDDRHIRVKFVDDLDIGLSSDGQPVDRSGGTLSSRGAAEILSFISDAGGNWIRTTGEKEAKMDEMRQAAQLNLGQAIADLNNYFILSVPEGESAEEWMDGLNSLPEVEIATPLPLAMPPPVPDYESMQGYLNPATEGIDAKHAWTLTGGTGSYVTVCDLEYSWNLNHDDLPPGIATWVMTGYTPVDPFNNNNHGTAVLGELVSQNNSWGTTGASHGVYMAVVPTFLRPLVGDSAWLLGVAISEALYNLWPGDVMLIEQQMAGPNWSPSTGDTGLVPVEWDLAIYNQIMTAVGNGMHVVECAGNGYQNLDDPVYNTGHAPFQLQNHSGAIIVGAGGVPSSYGGTYWDRSRITFSNYGTRLSLQGWGEMVTTTGYGYLYSGEGVDRYYTSTFSGTSSAAPNVASAVALLSSINEAYNGFFNQISPQMMLYWLGFTGSPQEGGLHPPWEIIGSRPNLKAAIMISGIADTLYEKRGYIDYCPDGVPDFSSLQDTLWRGYDRWTYDGPVALANCFWWFDSKFESVPIDPRPFYPGGGTVSDNYPMVTSYGAWDDHDTCNAKPLIEALASCAGTDDTTIEVPGIYEYGTRIDEMATCVDSWLTSAGLRDDYTDTIVTEPGFEYLTEELERSQDIILLLGFYCADSSDPMICCRIGGHYVNMVGVNSTTSRIAISDPFHSHSSGFDMTDPAAHNDAGDVVHEVYQIGSVDALMCDKMSGYLRLTDYPDWMTYQYEQLNGGLECWPMGVRKFYTVIEYALVICPVSEPPLDTCTYYKNSYNDYAPNGVPDFDQKQDNWKSPYTGFWSWCGPVALANCMWWFDSRYEPSPVDPRPFYPGPGNPSPDDDYPLIQSLASGGEWDDHDTCNADPFIQKLKSACRTDGPVPGTVIADLKKGFDSLVTDAGLAADYTSTLVPGPSFELIKDSVMASRNVILLLGFYEPDNSQDCVRLGGHYVTCAGVCTECTDICVSDPYFNSNENEPPAGSAHGATVHNDAYYVSGPHDTHHHDRYHMEAFSHSCTTPATERVTDYPNNWSDLINFAQQNWYDLSAPPPGAYEGGAIIVLVDYALVIAGPDVGCDCEPGNCNSDVDINMLDILYLIAYLYKGGPAPTPYALCSGDPDCNCANNMLDILHLISYLYKGGPAPCNCESWLGACGSPLRK
jgi:hypothetical protein